MMNKVVILALFGTINGQNNTRSAHGRDQDGKFKNHDKYLAMVNELNTAESTHETMFSEINKRITDPEFLDTTAKN